MAHQLRVTRPLSSLAALALLLLIAAPPLRAQDGPELFLDTVDVGVVNVEVVVTGPDGEPVRALTREDFVLREDGEPMEITNFYAVEGGGRVATEAEAEAGPLAEPDPAEPHRVPLPDDQRLNLVVLIDNLNISPTARNRVLGELEKRLDAVLRPGDRVLVAAANPEVRTIQPFTGDLDAVAAALERLETTSSRGRLHEADARFIRREIDRAAGSAAVGGPSGGLADDTTSSDARSTLNSIRAWAADKHTHNLRLLGTMERFVQALAGLPGRRAVLYVSQGFPVRPSEALIYEWFEAFPNEARDLGITSPESEAARWDASSELVELTEVAAGNHVTFYTLETGSSFHDDLDPEVGQIRSADRTGDLLNQGSLTDLAWRTGGVPLLHSGNVEALLDRMATDYRDYYSLGYSSPHSDDGEYHSIEVELPGHDVRVRHTEGFRATTPEQATTERTMSALIFDAAENPLGIKVEVGDEEEQKRNRYVLPVLVRVPIGSLTLLPQESAHVGRMSIVVAVQDADGDLSEPQTLDVPVEIPNERLLQAVIQDVGKQVNLLVRRGECKLAVGVRDELSGVHSTLNLNLSVGGGP